MKATTQRSARTPCCHRWLSCGRHKTTCRIACVCSDNLHFLQHEIGKRQRGEAALREANAESERCVPDIPQSSGRRSISAGAEATLRASEERWILKPPPLVSRLPTRTNLLLQLRRIPENARSHRRGTLFDRPRVARLSTMGGLSASVAHEVSQPLGAIIANSQACLRLLSGLAVDIEEARGGR